MSWDWLGNPQNVMLAVLLVVACLVYPTLREILSADDARAAAIGEVVARFVRERTLLDAVKGRVAIVEVDRVRFRPALG